MEPAPLATVLGAAADEKVAETAVEDRIIIASGPPVPKSLLTTLSILLTTMLLRSPKEVFRRFS